MVSRYEYYSKLPLNTLISFLKEYGTWLDKHELADLLMAIRVKKIKRVMWWSTIGFCVTYFAYSIGAILMNRSY